MVIIEEQLSARGFEQLGKSGVWTKKINEPRNGELRANVKSGKANFKDYEVDDTFETYSAVPELAEVKALLGDPEPKQGVAKAMQQAMTRAPPAKESAPTKEATPMVIPAQQNKPAVHKDFIVGAFDNLPETLVMKLGDKPYVTKAGLNFVGKKLGITVKVEPVRYSFEKHPDGMKIAIFKGIATDSEGREYVDYGIASVENTTQMIVKGGNLDHMASTRASNRALRLATACGYCSVEELPEPPKDVLEAEFSEA